jgi:hypothetical protein
MAYFSMAKGRNPHLPGNSSNNQSEMQILSCNSLNIIHSRVATSSHSSSLPSDERALSFLLRRTVELLYLPSKDPENVDDLLQSVVLLWLHPNLIRVLVPLHIRHISLIVLRIHTLLVHTVIQPHLSKPSVRNLLTRGTRCAIGEVNVAVVVVADASNVTDKTAAGTASGACRRVVMRNVTLANG